MRVTALGGTGKIGRHVVDHLLAAEHQVVGLVRNLGHRHAPGRRTPLHRPGPTPSVPDPRDRPTLKAKVLPVLAKMMFPNALTELRAMTAAVTDSGLDWTIARITNPTDKPPAGMLRAGFLGVDTVGSAMSRADIAAFLVAQLTDRTYLRAAPAISN